MSNLEKRLAEWNDIKEQYYLEGGKVKVVGKLTFRRPGSQNPRKS